MAGWLVSGLRAALDVSMPLPRAFHQLAEAGPGVGGQSVCGVPEIMEKWPSSEERL
jgi:hypothetical protein